MKFRLSTMALAVLVQAGLALATAQAQQASKSTSAAQPSEPSLARIHRVVADPPAELDAAIAVLEQDLARRQGDVHAKAAAVLQELKGKRDAYRVETEADAAQIQSRSEQELAQARQSLDDSWMALQGTKDRYLDTVQADVAIRRAVLQAEFDARQKAWQEAIDGLRADAARLSAERRVAIEARIEALKVRLEEEKALRLVHFRGALSIVVLGLTRCMNQRGIDNGALVQRQAPVIQVAIDHGQNPSRQLMLLQQRKLRMVVSSGMRSRLQTPGIPA